MSEMSWKCCNGCQCPCKNTDLCPDTAEHLIAQGNQNISHSSDTSKSSPTLDDLRDLEKRIEQRLKNMPNLSKTNDTIDLESNRSNQSNGTTNQMRGQDLQYNELLILRKRLQEAELRNAIIEEKVDRLERDHKRVNVQHINQLKQQILTFIEEKFSQFTQNL